MSSFHFTSNILHYMPLFGQHYVSVKNIFNIF